jgi:hypothetical protein
MSNICVKFYIFLQVFLNEKGDVAIREVNRLKIRQKELRICKVVYFLLEIRYFDGKLFLY